MRLRGSYSAPARASEGWTAGASTSVPVATRRSSDHEGRSGVGGCCRRGGAWNRGARALPSGAAAAPGKLVGVT